MAAIAHEQEIGSNMSPQRLWERVKSRLDPVTMHHRCAWYQKLSPDARREVDLWMKTWVLPDLDWASVKLMRRKVKRHA